MSETELGPALADAIKHGSYPDSEATASAEVQEAALPEVLRSLTEARDAVKEEVKALNAEYAGSDIDGWIIQAKRLQADIQESRNIARQIVEEAEAGKHLLCDWQDRSEKVTLLETEVKFNENLTETLQRVQKISDALAGAQSSAIKNHTLAALDKLDDAKSISEHVGRFASLRIMEELRVKAAHLRAEIIEGTEKGWNACMRIRRYQREISISSHDEGTDIAEIINALSRVGVLEAMIERFSKAIENTIWQPIIEGRSVLRLEGENAKVEDSSGVDGVQRVLCSLGTLLEYLHDKFPPSVQSLLSEKMMPSLLTTLIRHWLDEAVPPEVDQEGGIQKVIDTVNELAGKLESWGWYGHDELTEWVQSVPRLWFARRKEYALAAVKVAFLQGLHLRNTVERVETQVMGEEDSFTAEANRDNDWNADWNQEDDDVSQRGPAVTKEEEAVSAWGMDEDETSESKPDRETGVDKDDADAWGWGEDQDEKSSLPSPSLNRKSKLAVNGDLKPQTKVVALRETYTVTGLPDELLDIVSRALADAESLSKASPQETPLKPATSSLLSLPTLLLAMYRAAAPTCYSISISEGTGNMFLYNDSLQLVDRIESVAHSYGETETSSGVKLDADTKSLEAFAKRAYGREMESQRTILRDLLDGAQGFANCTVEPFASECENAVSMTIDRIRELGSQWRVILSRSALLQSLGSLLSTVLSKLIIDIEDMSDISELESKRLKSFCDQFTTLHDIFTRDSPDGEATDLTGVYTTNWFKFQYLAEILESSLADIQYLWKEGELKMEFEVDEIVDLIKALFAESEHRRRAINELKRSAITR